MERPERPRRHKSIVQRQSRPPRHQPSTAINFDMCFESDSDTAQNELLDLFDRPENKRSRGPVSFQNEIIRYQPAALSLPSMPGHSGSSSLGSSILLQSPSPTDSLRGNFSLTSDSTVRNPFSRSDHIFPKTSVVGGSSILQEIDDLCFPVPYNRRPILNARRRILAQRGQREVETDAQNDNISITTSVSNSNPFVLRESPLSPPLIDTGREANDETEVFTAPNQSHNNYPSLYSSNFGNGNRGQRSEESDDSQTVVCQILMHSHESQQRPTDIQVDVEQEHVSRDRDHNTPSVYSQIRSRIMRSISPINIFIQPLSPTSAPPNLISSPSPPVSPISPVTIIGHVDTYPFGQPTSPLTSPPASPVNTTVGVGQQVVQHFNILRNVSQSKSSSNEEMDQVNEVIILDTPERQNTAEPSITTELVSSAAADNLLNQPVASSTLTSNQLSSPSSTPPLPYSNKNAIKKDKTSDADKLRELNQNLVSLLECPVCLDFMVPPIFQCNKGHIVCTACRPKLSLCPTCRCKFAERNLAMEKVAEKLMYPCKNMLTGCNATLKLKDKVNHEQNCGYRQYECIVVSCDWKGYKPEIVVHLSMAHEEKLILGNEKVLVILHTSTRQSWLFYTYDEVFILTIIGEMGPNNKFFSCVQLVGAPEKTHQFIYSLKMHRNDPYMAVQYTHQVHSDELKPMNIFYGRKGIVMEMNEVKRYATRRMPNHSNHRYISVSIKIKRNI